MGKKRITEADAVAVMRAVGFEPLEAYPGSNPPWLCRCTTCGKESRPRHSTARVGMGCRFCAGVAPLAPEEAVALMRAGGFEPLEDYPGRKAIPWRCRCTTCGKESTPTLKRVVKGSGCRYCAGSAPHDPDAVVAKMRAAGLEPLEPFRNVDVPWLSRCKKCGLEVAPRFNSIRAGRSCLHCSITRRGRSRRLDSDAAVAELREAQFEPLEEYPGSGKPWRCRCLVCGHDVEPSLANLRKGEADGTKRRGCAYCAAVRVDPDAAVQVMREAGLEPLGPYQGSAVPWPCQCQQCGAEVSPRYANVRLGRGCINCAIFGFDPTEPAWLYLLCHPEHLAIKVGITNHPADRIDRAHVGRGWQSVRLWSVPGIGARDVERLVIQAWRDGGLPPAMPKGSDGYSETVSMMSVEVDDVILEVERLIRQAVRSGT